jgi:hypothetical protein
MTTEHEAFVEYRLRELAAFEQRASGEVTAQRRPPTSQHPTESPMFQPAANTTAYLKAGITGEPGAGKSMTAGLLAIGLVKHLKHLNVPGADKPVGFFDTEKGSDWLIPLFEESGIPLVVAKERTYAKTLEAFRYMKENCVVGIFDSVTHPWEDLKSSFMKKKQRSFLQIDEIVQCKRLWQTEFNDEYMNSPFHTIICGRAGDETEQWVDENGKRQFEKVGVKMATEKSTAYEPSLSILMERDMDLRSKLVTHFATVTKDRSTLLDGKQFTFASYLYNGDRMPTDTLVKQVFVSFKPHIDRLNLGGHHMAVQTGRDSTHIIKTERRDWHPVQRRIVLDEIKDLMTLKVPGQTAADKQRRVMLLREHFSAGWVEIEETMDLLTLRAGFDSLHCDLEGKPSRYSAAMEAEVVPPLADDIPDSLPDHSKAPATSQVAAAAA